MSELTESLRKADVSATASYGGAWKSIYATAADLIEEQAARIEELQAELEREKKETERIDGAWNALHERMVKDNESHARYFEKSQARIHELFDAEAASQARLSEAVKVLERLAEGERSDTGHTALREAAKAFITTLGVEQE